MNWNQAFQAQLVLQPDQQSLLQIVTGGRDGQKMRLVSDDQMLVLKKDFSVEGNALFSKQCAVVIQAHMATVRCFGRDGAAKFVHDEARRHALQPRFTGNGREALRQKISEGGPVTSG